MESIRVRNFFADALQEEQQQQQRQQQQQQQGRPQEQEQPRQRPPQLATRSSVRQAVHGVLRRALLRRLAQRRAAGLTKATGLTKEQWRRVLRQALLLEDFLYRTAHSREEYQDPATLEGRVLRAGRALYAARGMKWERREADAAAGGGSAREGVAGGR